MGCGNAFCSSPLPPGAVQWRLKTLLDTSPDHWTYAIFWRPSHSSSLGWGSGFYRGPEDPAEEKLKVAECSAVQQDHRKRVLRKLSFLVSESDPTSDHLAVEDDVTDTEWFFLMSMFEKWQNGGGLPAQAWADRSPVWIAGAEQLEGSGCDRARRGEAHGLKTMAFIPLHHGVVELGSTELVRQDSGLVKEVQALFDTKKRRDQAKK